MPRTGVVLQGFLALFAGDTGEIRHEVREQIDAKVCPSQTLLRVFWQAAASLKHIAMALLWLIL